MSPHPSPKEPKAANVGQGATTEPTEADGPGKKSHPGPPPAAEDAPAEQGPAETEADAAASEPEGNELAIKLLEAKLQQSEARLNATLGQYKDALDEFASVKARLRRDISKEIDTGKRSMLAELLDVVDNLERAIEAAKGANETNSSFFKGVSMVRDQFLQKLENLGVTRRLAEGQPFDPDHFEAISTVPVLSAKEDGIVLGVVRDCYMLGQETLRHGMVAVGKYNKA